MADRGAKYADKALSKIDKALQSTYRTASRELSKKLADFNKAFAVKDREKRKKRDNGEITEKDYQDWLGGQVFMRKQWERKVKQVNEVMLHHNEQAVRIINESSFDVFAENYYAEAFKSQWICQNISFNVYNSQAIARLIKENPQLLPEWKIDEKKDYTWNYKKVNNIVQQGIIQGESVEQIAQRLCRDLSSMNESKMRMFARTAITCGQNAGRHLQMEEAAKLDIEQEKRWTATLDGHTRDSHRAMDGETVPWNKPYSNKLMFPGDPNGAPEEVYNCRCTEETIYPQYEDRQKDWREDETIDGVPYEVWKQGKKAAKDWKKGQENDKAKEGTSKEADIRIEQFRKAAEKSSNKVEFWMNLDEKQQAEFMAGGFNLDEMFKMLGGGKNISEWKEASPGGAESFAIKHDFTDATVKYNKVKPKGEGWMADANGAGIVNIRSDGLGSDWEHIITHELGHQLSNYCPELQQTIMTNPGNVLGRYNMRLMAFDGVYGEYNPEEAFATSVSVYIRYPKEMKEKYPETYNAIEALFTASPTARTFVENAVASYRKEFMK